MNRNATPWLPQFAQLGEEPLDAAGVELRGGLVEDDQPGAEGQRPGDLHELPLLDGEVLGPGAGVDVHAVLAEQRPGARAQRPPADGAGRPGKRFRKRFSATVRSGTTIDFW